RSGEMPRRRRGRAHLVSASSIALTGVVAVSETPARARLTRSTNVSTALAPPYHHHWNAPATTAMTSTGRVARHSERIGTRATTASSSVTARNAPAAGRLRTTTIARLRAARPMTLAPTG